MSAVSHALATARPLPLVAAIGCYVAGALAVGERLYRAAASARVDLRRMPATAVGLSGVLASHVTLGAAAGEGARLAWLARYADVRRAMVSLAIDRAADGAAIAMLVLLAVPGRTLAALVPLTLAALALVVLRRLAPLVAPRTLARGVLAALPAALAAWALDVARLSCAATAVGARFNLRVVAALALAALVGGQAPTPAGLGAVEGAMVAAGVALGQPVAPVLATALLDRALTLSLGTALGALCTSYLGRALRRTR